MTAMTAAGTETNDDAPLLIDPVLAADWHPVAASAALTGTAPQAVTLLGRRLAIWRDGSGRARATADRCPHRGAALSLGTVVDGALRCPYHGWTFDGDGQCTAWPSQPGFTPPARACVASYGCTEAHGLVWVCLDPQAAGAHAAPPPLPELGTPGLRQVVCGPYPVRACAPRIIENFLDMAHFAYVHGGILGDFDHVGVHDYRVETLDCPARGTGIIALDCRAWQPQASLEAAGGEWIAYTYRVVRPLTAILTKRPERSDAPSPAVEDAIALYVQPVGAAQSIAWIVMALDIPAGREAEARAFQDTIFLQDLPVVESQRPQPLPLDPGAEFSQPADRMSRAYRRYLDASGILTGVTR